MALTPAPTGPRRSQLRASSRGMPSMTERQLHAYLLTRGTLRRLREVASMNSDTQLGPAPGSQA